MLDALDEGPGSDWQHEEARVARHASLGELESLGEIAFSG
jgi:hypothetical protein